MSGFHKVVVVGSGLMGMGIAQVAAAAGKDVVVCDIKEEFLARAKTAIQKSLKRVHTKQVQKRLHIKENLEGSKAADEVEELTAKVMARISYSLDSSDAVKDADLVIEAVPEILGLKTKIFKGLDAAAPPTCIFASNTSSLSIQEIANATSPSRAANFCGLHFFNPVPVMKLVEVINLKHTSAKTHSRILLFCKEIKKQPITCVDTPGFVVNRLLVPYLMEAIKLLERKVASPRDIDVAMQLGANMPMGPLKLADYIGLDTCLNIIEGWHKNNPNNPVFTPPESLRALVKGGDFGVKTGKGFYEYRKNISKL